jgi:LmbE family N-acetylglucosaminyl deacetylase
LMLFHIGTSNNKNYLADNLPKFPEATFNKQDCILIIAPHPDDETLANSSVIIKGKEAGATVKVVFVTFGEHNTSTLAKFLLFPSPPTVDLLAKRRHREAISAAKLLGLSESNLIFLGFPDFGTLKIWDDYFGDKPYVAGMNLHDKVFYAGSYKERVLFTGSGELKLFEEIISSYKPTKIFYPSTLDLNPDHRATGLFTEAALFDLNSIVKPDSFVYFVHSEDWPEPVGYYPDDYLSPPSYFTNLTGNWLISFLSKSEEILKLKAVKAYFSQYWTKPKFMASFIRKNELFLTDYQYKLNSNLPLWTREEMQRLKVTSYVEEMSVSDTGDSYEFGAVLYKGVPAFSKIILFVYPEIKGKLFVDSPKYKVVIKKGVRKNIELILFDRGKEIESKKDSILGRVNELTFKIDMNKSYFIDCEGFFCSAYIEEVEHRVSETPWWLISVK